MFFQLNKKKRPPFVLKALALSLLTCNSPILLAQNQTATETQEETPHPSKIITNAVTSSKVNSSDLQPIDVTDNFPSNQSVFHVVVTLFKAPENSRVKVVWMTNTGDKLGEYEMHTYGSRNLDFSLKPENGGLPPGTYKANIFMWMDFSIAICTLLLGILRNKQDPNQRKTSSQLQNSLMMSS